MSATATIYGGGLIFDGEVLREGYAARFINGCLIEVALERQVKQDGDYVDLSGDILSAGYVDLQVNGGDGVMFNADPSVETLTRMAAAHRRLGATTILPTLISDTPDKSRAAVVAIKKAIAAGVAGIGGLHLEGPHLSVSRKGAHDADLIRAMTAEDLENLVVAASDLPALMITIAPENVTRAQVAALVKAGAIVSLGHTDASFATCIAYAEAGAECATHLFNAMSPLGNREPGLVGAALVSGRLSAGLIADGVHVHPQTIKAAWDAKQKPGRLFLISDAMATAGSSIREFELGGRRITRHGGRLTLDNGTLAGTDLNLTKAIKVLVEDVGIDPAHALRAATSVPAQLLKAPPEVGRLLPNKTQNPIRILHDLSDTRNLSP
ncbi:MAG: N-acetylglucosamine-6-phosphate deacetylase [Alphaproteobacteria bacterium]